MKDHDSPASEALSLVRHHFPHAMGALLGGSAARGHTSASSDLDVAVLLPDSDTGRREVIRHNGRLTELFLPRRLLSADPIRGQALPDGHQRVAEHADTAPLAVAAERVLDLIGGLLREGYTQR
ncbi:nucleotidyltransferase domain-containing protein [Streptomyces rimosus]|uniref:nucleotidyltransferase domain-containing protein n=1 Tax=Streptomyces rimosus TaxID=1927 RepID=UPI00099E183E|nr:nucleotidyltransferase domain-containing protein [Streptomyces rimosus]